MKSGQKGFTLVETLLVLILVGVIGFTGYYVYHVRNNANSTYNKSAATSNSASNTQEWQTYTGKVADNAQNPAVRTDQIAYSFKYPASWKFYPNGAEATASSQTGSYSFQEIAPSLKSDKAIDFYSITSTKNAKDYYTNTVGDQSGLVGPVWQVVKSFTTKRGYSVYVTKLEASTGTNYEAFVSNNKTGLVDFHYGAAMAADDSTLQQIFDSVDIP